MKCFNFEIAYDNGKMMILATSRKEALEKFVEEWERYGDNAPEHWIVGQWSVNS